MTTKGTTAVAEEALHVESSRVRVWKRGGRLVLLIIALTLTSVALGVPFAPAFAAGFALEVWRRMHAARWARPRPARVLVGADRGDQLVIERDVERFRVKKSSISDCWQVPDPETDGVEVRVVTPRSQLAIHLADSASADTLRRALGIDISSQLVGTTLTGPPTLPRMTWREEFWRMASAGLESMLYVIAIVGPSLIALAGISTLVTLSLVLPAMVLLPILGAIRSVSRAATPARVYVGRDGLLVTTADRREFIGFERVKGVQSRVLAIVITLTDRQSVKLPLSVRTGGLFSRKPHPLDEWVRDVDQVLARRNALAQQITDALSHFRNAERDARTETLARRLDRDSRPIPEWREALSHAQEDTYREHHLDADQLVNVLENPRIPVAQRVGAALALAGRADEAGSGREHASRARAAIASSANRKVRIALERAVEGKLDEAAYERAIAAEADAEQLASRKRRLKA